MVGALAGFALLGLIVRLTGSVPFEPSYGVLRRTGMIQLLAVSGALGGATLVALIHSRVAGRSARSLPPRLTSLSRHLS